VIPTIDLMRPTLVSTPFHREGWIYEENYDGWRMLLYKNGSQVNLVSRAGRDHTRRFPTLVKAISSPTPSRLILDGEVCIFDQQLISRFEWLRARPKVETATSPIFMAFDRSDLRQESFSVRRNHLRGES